MKHLFDTLLKNNTLISSSRSIYSLYASRPSLGDLRGDRQGLTGRRERVVLTRLACARRDAHVLVHHNSIVG